ncbi:bifunctional 2-polyprenyl-6-hydroxyphenol methylase/3-demethylubiquinol 3-O-methyltransferase UbiG [Neorhizobium sp. T7_12]|uniref:class I SAM-dependent methyltransferase n=1 Tax=Neorhizobium sp. T7_12 TaxID=2093832 RepID=UPI000CFA5385|nr:class I SAM-dependent methyltransferase [Neorhizobium sp. T7_12]
MESTSYESDLEETLANRERLRSNPNLLYWYEQLYRYQFAHEPGLDSAKILEIGSGTSPLKQFVPNVTTSDVLALDYLDLVFDCHRIRDLAEIPDRSVDVITMTNVLHHLKDPLAFLRDATAKLVPGGRVYFAEPFFSVLSYPMYRLLHHEPVDFNIERPVLNRVHGPLSTSNQAMPHMIFFSRPEWLAELGDVYDLKQTDVRYFSGISYPLTGGISRRFPMPAPLYKLVHSIDQALVRRLPRVLASFFVGTLVASK